MKPTYVLVINCGSSSLKYKLFCDGQAIASGTISKITLESGAIKHETARGVVRQEGRYPDHTAAISAMIEMLTHPEHGVISDLSQITAVGHRVLHGGDELTSSMIVTEEVKKTIERCIDLGPLHNPANLTGIVTCEKLMTGIPQVAVFDTAFHQTMPEKAFMYAIPYEYYKNFKIRKFGFHGTSHRYLSQRTCQVMNRPAEGLRLVICHLGNGSSLSAVKDGKCVDTTMGLTPLQGLVMGTRCGSVDPAVVGVLSEKLGRTAKDVVDTILNKESGMLGICGTPDMVEIGQLIRGEDQEKAKMATLAREMLVYSIQKHIGEMIVALGGVDAIVFSGGIGENDRTVREMVVTGLPEIFGAKLDVEKNAAVRPGSGFEGVISTDDSPVQVLVVPTDEELMIAMDTLDLVRPEA